MADDRDQPTGAAEAGDEEMAGSSDSDSDFEELDISAEDAQLLQKLEQQLQDNPNLYDSHVQVRRRCLPPPAAPPACPGHLQCFNSQPSCLSPAQFIEVLRRCKMMSRLREARQAMHAAFPLTEALW